MSITCKAPPGANEAMVSADPVRCFIPSYAGPRGWVGVRLDLDAVDWDRVELLLFEAYRITAPKKLIAKLEPDRD